MRNISVSRRHLVLGGSAAAMAATMWAGGAPAQPGKKVLVPAAMADAQALGAAATSLQAYSTTLRSVNAKSKPGSADLAALNHRAASVKGALGSMKTALTAIIAKSKENGTWANLDTLFPAALAAADAPAAYKTALASLVRRSGGAKATLTGALSSLSTLPASLDQDIAMVHRKTTVFNFELISPAYAMSLVRCAIIGAIGIGATLAGCLGCGVGAVIAMAKEC